jgi:hypothetical protein
MDWKPKRLAGYLLLSLVMICIALTGCDRQPQQANAAQDRNLLLESQMIEESADIESRQTAFSPSPRQENEFDHVVEPRRLPREILVHCVKVDQAPVIDGNGTDSVWELGQPVETLDYSSQRTILLTVLHDDARIYIRAIYADQAPSITHKSWYWNASEAYYTQGLDREDMFVLKWSMQGLDAKISLHQAKPHVADIWFWKACRTNPAGYWDDKRHELSAEPVEKSLKIQTVDGRVGYLRRIGDEGKQAYAEVFPSNFTKPYLARYTMSTPTLSRGDVQGKGIWNAGQWTLECQRLLKTGHDDDLQFEQGQQYLFGLACYEMAGTGVDDSYSQPLYRTGDVFDRLILVVE